MTSEHLMEDHDSLIRLESKVEALISTVEAHNIASVERDTRIEEQVKKINGGFRQHDEKLSVLWNDRSVWNWLTRIAIICTPVVVGVANYFTR